MGWPTELAPLARLTMQAIINHQTATQKPNRLANDMRVRARRWVRARARLAEGLPGLLKKLQVLWKRVLCGMKIFPCCNV